MLRNGLARFVSSILYVCLSALIGCSGGGGSPANTAVSVPNPSSSLNPSPSISPTPTTTASPISPSGIVVVSPAGTSADPIDEPTLSSWKLTATEVGYVGTFTISQQTILPTGGYTNPGSCWSFTPSNTAVNGIATWNLAPTSALCIGPGLTETFTVTDNKGHSATAYVHEWDHIGPTPAPTSTPTIASPVSLSPMGTAAAPANESILSPFALNATESKYVGGFSAQTIVGSCWVASEMTTTYNQGPPPTSGANFLVSPSGLLCVGGFNGDTEQIKVTDSNGNSTTTYIHSI